MTYIKIPFDKVEILIAYNESGNNIDNPKLMSEIEQWCYDNLKFQPILPQRKDHKKIVNEFLNKEIENEFLNDRDYEASEGLYYIAYILMGIGFKSDADAILFKMRWL